MRALVIALLMLLVGASAQFQPTSPDWSAFEAREDLATAGDLAGAQRVLRFVQVSDAHILDDDAPAPMRVDALDAVFFGTGVSDGARRPQEEYTDEALDATIRAINGIHAADPLDFVINTGDNVDNDLENELMRFIDNWEGTLTTAGPISGVSCQPDGQSTDAEDDSHDVSDACTHLPMAVSDANTPLAVGLPWYSAFGNHDGLIQGNVPVEPSFQDIAAEYGRYFLKQTEFVQMHFNDGACVSGKGGGDVADDFGHGYGFAGDRLCDDDPDNDGYYSFAGRGIRFIVLDTVNDDFVTGNANLAGQFNPETTLGNDLVGGYSEGAIDPAQYAWLLGELDRHKDELVVLMSHHTVNSMFTDRAEGYCGGPNGECLHDLLTAAGYKTGADLTEALAAYPNVIAWVGGHTHQNRVSPTSSPGGDSPGFWTVETSSIIDMPQEARVIEVWVTADGAKGFLTLTPFTHDFTKSRDLAMTDDQFDVEEATGTSKDRQVVLWFDVPPLVKLDPQPELPRALRIDGAAPVLANGSHGQVGVPMEIVLRATDPATDAAVSGLAIHATVEHADADAPTQVKRVVDTTMTDRGDGTYNVTFTPDAARVHYLSYHVTDPAGGYPAVSRVLSYDVVAMETTAAPGKKSPMVAVPLVALAFAALALRRK